MSNQTESSDAGHSEKSGGQFVSPKAIAERLRKIVMLDLDEEQGTLRNIEEAASTIERLVKALEPFAEAADYLNQDALLARIRISDDLDWRLTGKQIHNARRALTGEE